MQQRRVVEAIVGLFMILGVAAIFALAFKTSNLHHFNFRNAFLVNAVFDNVGDLKVRAPVTIAGVRVGEVTAIELDRETFKARVTLLISNEQRNLPNDTTAKILTAGIIGANYIELLPGYSEDNLTPNAQITDTQPAIVLENLVSQLIYNLGASKK